MPASAPGLLATDTEVDAARWVRRKLGCVAHEERVLATASRLFDLTRDVLDLSDPDHELLRLAALTHDVGRFVSDKDHPAEGAAMIDRTASLELSPVRRRRLAFLARYHRGAVPSTPNEEYLHPADPRRPLRGVLALLRTADALDHRHQPARRVTLRLNGRRLMIRCTVAGNLSDARRVYQRPKKYRLLESLLGHPIHVDVNADD